MTRSFPNPVITFLPIYQDAVLMYRRGLDERNYPGLWAFPGGKVEIGETMIGAMFRELAEETNLTSTNRIVFLNTYWFGTSVGITFGVEVTSKNVRSDTEYEEIKWVADASEFASLQRIPGIDNHYAALKQMKSDSQRWTTVDNVDLTPDKYLNKG